MKLWKGLFYCMWMSDKPLIQEDLAEMISSLVHCVVDRKTGLRFTEAALKTMARDWPGIDVWRMDKFLMVRLFYSPWNTYSNLCPDSLSGELCVTASNTLPMRVGKKKRWPRMAKCFPTLSLMPTQVQPPGRFPLVCSFTLQACFLRS